MNAWWTTAEMEYGLNDSRPKVLIADDERLERVLPVLDEAARRAHRCTSSRVRSERPLPDDAAAGPTSSAGGRAGNAARRRRSTPTTTPASSTRRAPPASRRARSSPIAVRCTTSSTWCSWARPSALAEAKAVAAGEVEPPERRPTPPGAAGVHGTHPAVPRDRLQLPAAPVHRWPAAALVLTYKWDPGRALELIEREQRDQLLGCAHDEPRAADAPRLGRRATPRRCWAWVAAAPRCSPTWSARSPAR